MARLHNYSQHFLRSPRIAAELVGHSNIRKSDTVYDLGAGSGVIASVLANKCKLVVAVESEPAALQKLRQNLGAVNTVQIIEADILSLPIPNEPYKIFSNIPFSMTSDIVRKYTTSSLPPDALYLIVQKQFARKLTPGTDHFTSMLSAQIAPWFDVRIRKPMQKSDYTPPPAVDTVLLEIKPKSEALVPKEFGPKYRDFIKSCFENKAFFTKQPRSDAGISPERTPSQLSPEQWSALAREVL